ncbi:hypothetical protein D9757_009297 [Collybiopsis confluens]|uniref:Carbohydrate-binding module family 19 domain-containing protein n=1 Tax=Collybiopsis confluens TaxID=2823264 RepID=A0A8H5G398_9AGAR|nr:hypothetical protein D9757_012352 [Collybiopsis confluens]KAF5376196.1 hypothetical protein D9757_009297 [Collybiopsis confluens]
MVQINALFVLSAALMASAAPIQKRIAQTIADSTAPWVAACTKAGGAGQCSTISQTAFTTLLAAGGNCDQQNAADQMIDLAKTLKNDPDMIRLAQIFVQQPRNAPDSLQVPYCQTAPKNAELNGFFHCQFAGTAAAGFSGDQTGNLPLGLTAVNPPGSCPALSTPVPDSEQLNTLVTSPGTPLGGSGSAAGSAGAGAAATSASNTTASTGSTSASTGSAANNVGSGSAAAAASPAPAVPAAGAASASSATGASGASGFKLQNGEDAIKLNAQFASLTASSPCTDGEQACVNGGFAQCVGGSFQITQCSGGTQCFALPLVNSAGTSITCTTAADKDARIAATGAA